MAKTNEKTIQPKIGSEDLKLFQSMKRLLMQTPDDIRRDLIGRMSPDDSEEILNWLDLTCGQYSYHLIKIKED